MTGTAHDQASRRPRPACGVQLDKGGKTSTVEAEVLLVAVGRKPVTEGLGLEALGIAIETRLRQGQRVDADRACRTIYAIGDVVPTPWLAHVASAEGILAVEHMAGQRARGRSTTTACRRAPTASRRSAASGSPRPRRRERGYDVEVGKFPFTALGKARDPRARPRAS